MTFEEECEYCGKVIRAETEAQVKAWMNNHLVTHGEYNRLIERRKGKKKYRSEKERKRRRERRERAERIRREAKKFLEKTRIPRKTSIICRRTGLNVNNRQVAQALRYSSEIANMTENPKNPASWMLKTRSKEVKT